jgi:hypothetical protein
VATLASVSKPVTCTGWLSSRFIALATWVDLRKTKLVAAQEEGLRQLVSRYEQLAEKTLDAQQRVAAEMSELRSRAASIEQILRSVE